MPGPEKRNIGNWPATHYAQAIACDSGQVYIVGLPWRGHGQLPAIAGDCS